MLGAGILRSTVRASPSLIALLALASAGITIVATAQSSEFRPSDSGQWAPTRNLATEGDEDEQALALAARAFADDDAAGARDILTEWLDSNERTKKKQVPAALLLRGDASLALDRETAALEDYEKLIKRFPQTEQYVAALERELEVGVAYVHGKKRKFLGIRFEDAGDLGVEILIRVQERLPSSALAERAAIEMADYYFREREMSLAADSYDLYVLNFPNGPNRLKALERRIYASIARFQGPEHDASGLLDAREQIRGFAAQYPDEARRQGLDSALVTRLDESAAAQRLNTAEWYMTTGDDAGCRLTLRRLLAKHPQTAAAEKARAILTERGWDAATPTPANALPRDPETGRLMSGPDAAPGVRQPSPTPGAGAPR